MTDKTFTVLSIEDNKPDFLLLEKALNSIENVSLNIINVINGKEALDFMYKKGEYKSAPVPDMIILDINLPLVDGKEVLKRLKKDEIYRIIPIIIFSTSSSYPDIEESYKLYANSYITKTFDVKELFKKITIMGEYWLKNNESPVLNNFYFVQENKEKE